MQAKRRRAAGAPGGVAPVSVAPGSHRRALRCRSLSIYTLGIKTLQHLRGGPRAVELAQCTGETNHLLMQQARSTGPTCRGVRAELRPPCHGTSTV